MPKPELRTLLLVWITVAAVACGGGSASAPSVAAKVPNDLGSLKIAMTGTWTVVSGEEVESSNPGLVSRLGVASLLIGEQALLSVSGFTVRRRDIEKIPAYPLDYYINQHDSRRLMFGHRATDTSGVTHEYGIAAGAMDGDTIIAQVYSGSRSSAGSGFVIYNMTLRRL